MAKDEQGTGKHPHKSSEEPYPHHKGGTDESGRSQHASSGSQHGTQSSRSGDEGSESSDLKEREYRDAQGNVHHHTRTSESQHGKEK